MDLPNGPPPRRRTLRLCVFALLVPTGCVTTTAPPPAIPAMVPERVEDAPPASRQIRLLGRPVQTEIPERTDDRSGGAAMEFRSHRLELAYSWAYQRSPTFRSAMYALERGPHFQIIVGHHTDFHGAYEEWVARSGVAGIFPHAGKPGTIPADGTPVDGVDIVFFTEPTEQAALALGFSYERIIAELAVVLVHELYGHVLPLIATGVWPTPCPDPGWGRPAAELGCAGERENEIRAELGFPARARYGAVDLPFLCAGDPELCARIRGGPAR
jgi:hypothetical protein